MSREYQVGALYLNESSEKEFQASVLYLNETQAASSYDGSTFPHPTAQTPASETIEVVPY